MSLEPVHLDFVESYTPPFGRGKNPFPLLGLSGAQLDAIAAWDAADERAEPMRDEPKPQGDPLRDEVREAPRRGDEPQRSDRERVKEQLPVDERP